MDDVRSVLLIAALSNAVKHKSVPAAGAVMGAILGTHPELRSKACEIKGLLDRSSRRSLHYRQTIGKRS